jgi:hypothetical protein
MGTDIKLAPIPDRRPVKITISVSPELSRALSDYAGFYEAAYGRAVSVPDLIPAVLQSFLESDRGFARRRRGVDAARAS